MEIQNHPFDPIGKWWHDGPSTQFGLANSYLIAAGYLDGLPVVEDWGCGSGFAKRFFSRSQYVGVDGTGSKHCDIVDDVRTRSSNPDGIMIRHVLEHNPKWPLILSNALKRFKTRMALVLYLPPGPSDLLIEDPKAGFPSIWIGQDKFLPMISQFNPVKIQTPGDVEATYLFQK